MKKSDSFGRTAKKGALWSVIRQGGHELIAIPSSMIMARILSPQEFGITVAASFFVVLATRLTQFGFGAALVRVKELRHEHVSSVFVVNLMMGAISYGLLVLAAPWLGWWLRSPEAGALLPIAALTFLVTPFGTVATALISRRMQFGYMAVTDWVHKIVGVAATVALALSGWSYWSVAYGAVLAIVVRVLLQMYLARWRPSLTFSRAALKELLSFGLGVQSKHVLEYVAFNIDNLIVGRMLGMTALGFYDKAFSTMDRLVDRLHLGQAPFRIFAIIHEDAARFRRAYSRLMLAVTLFAYPTFAAAIVVAQPLFVVMYGERWYPAVFPFQLLCAAGMLKLLNRYGALANEAAGRIWSQVARQALGVGFVILGAGLGSRYGGVNGAAVGVAVAMLMLTLCMQALVRNATGLSWREMFVPHLPGLTCAGAVVLVLLATTACFKAIVPHPHALSLLLTQVATGSVFVAVFMLLSPFAVVRSLVREMVEDLVPGRPGRVLLRLTRFGSAWGTL